MTTATTTNLTDRLLGLLKEAETLKEAARLLAWDQETKMPPKGSASRADQLALLSGMHHDMATKPEIGDLIGEAESAGGHDEQTAAALREIRRDYDQATKLPKDLVEELARTSSLGMDGWKAARAAKDFKQFLPWLEKTIELSRRKAECLGTPDGGKEAYDALLDTFEPHMTSAEVERLFAPLREATVDLLGRLRDRTKNFTELPDESAASLVTDTAAQKAFCTEVLGAMGFDFEAGRLDEAAHPFCEGAAAGDTRLTNRYRPDGWLDALSGGMHEGGHGLYEQGLPKTQHGGSPLSSAVSLGIHESQSRMWENQVGRSREFWDWALPVAQKHLGAPLSGVSSDAVFRATNMMKPSFIRVESDELTYNLHIMLRFDMERAMLRGELACKDLPGAWNERFENDWGMPVTDDSVGCLQDVHWSMGAVGYFPTYTLGNLYAAQLWEAMSEDIPDRAAKVSAGEFAPILAWTRDKVHAHGRRYPAIELGKRATGHVLSHEALVRHLEAKAAAVFGL